MPTEMSGDGHLTFGQRVRYLAINFLRNLKFGAPRVKRSFFCAPRLPSTSPTASPSRALTEAFLHRHLPDMLPPNNVRVLEIGCGSGRLANILAGLGYSGTYVGVDIADRFDRTPLAGFEKTFVAADIHEFEPEGHFDLIVSVSALEHIPDDHRLIRQLSQYVAPHGVQLHFVPSGWGLPVYIWHGYRQYTARALGERFDARQTMAYAMGGAASFLLHLSVITFGEMLFRLRLRQRMPLVYGRLLDLCLHLDCLLPACATMYAVCVHAAVGDMKRVGPMNTAQFTVSGVER